MDFFIRIAEKFILANRRLRKLKRAVSVMMAITVFVTTYAMILPAITLDKGTASAQSGIEIASSDTEPDSGGTVSEAGAGEEPDETDRQGGPVIDYDAEPGEVLQYEESEEPDENSSGEPQDADTSEEDTTEEDDSGRATGSDSGQNTEEQTITEEYLDADDAGSGEIAEDSAITETLADGETLAVGGAAEESRLITEKTLLTYEYIDEYYEDGIDDENDDGIDDGYFVYVEFGADAKLPEGVELTAEEITKESDPEAYEAYYEKALSGLQDKYDENAVLSFARFYDIRFVYNGGEVEPAGEVKVRIEYKKAIEIPKETNVDAVHFDRNNDEEPEVIRSEVNSPEGIGPEGSGVKGNSSEVSGAKGGRLKAARSGAARSEAESESGGDEIVKTVDFESDKFSVYGIVGTVIEKTVLASDGRNYTVTATYGADTGIPANADLSVEEIMESSSLYDAYVAGTENVLGMEEGSAGYIRLFDIRIVDKDDPNVKYQPVEGTTVEVRIELADKDAGDEAAIDTRVVHFTDGAETGEVINADINGQTVYFETKGFSIYAIVDDTKIITVNFYDGDGNFITSEFVKKNANKIEDLYSPGFELEYGERFYGWATSQDAVSGLDIDALNADFKANWNRYSSDVPVNYYAVVKKVYVVTFNKYDDEGGLIVLDTVTIPLDQANKTITIPGDLGAEAGNDFLGWLGQDGTLYNEGQFFTVNDHYSFFMKEQGRYWLVFDSNAGGPGSGATYTPPQLIYGEGVVTVQPSNPTRTGYSFIGWNTSPDGSGTWWYKTDGSVDNRFGGTISADTTLYAQWEGDLTKYYVLYWQQDVNDEAGIGDDQKQYHYVGSREVTTARTGDTVSTINSDRNKGGTTGYEQYHYNGTKSQTTTTVAADGTTTLNVYYDLNDYTLTFYVNGYTYTETTSNSGTQYGVVNGQQARIYYRNGAWRTSNTNNGPIYNGTRYTRSNSTSWHAVKTINALYGHNISSEFPIVGNEGLTYNNGERWMPQTNSIGLTEVMVYLDVMPGGNVNFRLNTATHTTKHMHYYVEALPGQAGTRTYNGKNFVEYKSFDANYNYFTAAEDYVDLVGFSKSNAYPPEGYNNNGAKVNTVWNNSNAINVYCYYLRNQYKIHFVSVSDGRQETDESVFYEEALSEYSNVIPTNGLDGYAFVGWYSDESCAPGTEYDFSSTMPANDITLYAKWEEQRCRVVLDPNAPTGEYSFANNQSLSFRMDYNEKLSGANITGSAVSRPGYSLDGWYTESGRPWNFETQVNDSVEGVNSEYQSTADWYDNVYGDNDGEHNNVKSILKLKAKWKLNIEDNSVYVIYKVNDVYYTYNANGDLQTIIPVDDTAYVLQEGATDVSFRTEPAPSGYNDGYVFRDWALLTSSGEKSGITFLDGEHATVDEEYFVTETIVDDDGNEGTLHYVVLEAQFDPNENRATAVVYHGNGGTTGNGSTTIGESYLVNKSFNILGEDAFEREGYTFVEWNTKADGTGTSLDAGAEVAADNLDGTAWDSVGRTNNLYAIWDINSYTVTVEKVVDGETSTDKEFTFSASASGDYTIPEGDSNFLLVNDGYKNFAEVPYGTILTFSETAASGYSIQSVVAKQTTLPDKTPLEEADYIDLDGADGKSYTIKGDTVITYTNEKAQEQKLRIHKIGNDAEEGLAGAKFDLTAAGVDGFVNMTGMISMGGTTDGTTDPANLGYLPGNDNTDTTLFLLPVGTYTLSETEAPVYYECLSGDVTLAVTAEGITMSKGADSDVVVLSEPVDGVYTLTVTNTRKLGTVTIVKNVIGTDADKEETYIFSQTGLTGESTFVLRGSDNETTEEIAENQTVFADVPYGKVFSITEDSTYTDFDTMIVISNEASAVTDTRLATGEVTVDSDVTITYTNTRNNQPIKVFKYETGTSPEKPLANAVFSLTGPEGTGISYTGLTTNADGYLVNGDGIIFKLPVSDGTYTLTETQAPDGYLMIDGGTATFTVSAEDVIGAVAETQKIEGEDVEGEEVPTGNYVIKIQNSAGVQLPHTGGVGTNLIYLLGFMLTGIAGAGLVMRRKRM